jgi:hypothetical protein
VKSTYEPLILADFNCAQLTEALASNAAMEAIAKEGRKTLEATFNFKTLIRTPRKMEVPKGKELTLYHRGSILGMSIGRRDYLTFVCGAQVDPL